MSPTKSDRSSASPGLGSGKLHSTGNNNEKLEVFELKDSGIPGMFEQPGSYLARPESWGGPTKGSMITNPHFKKLDYQDDGDD